MAEALISSILEQLVSILEQLDKEQLGSSIATYDIFLSFRGKDTRTNFTDHLYDNLKRAGFHTFRDDDELDVGEKIDAGLHRAIQESKISVVVFSKDYASSRWCLDELVTISKKDVSDGNHTLIPIFYDVTPSQVGKQSGSFASSFDKHKEQFHTDKINEWRAALKHATDLKGMELKDGHESHFIQDVVREIRNILPPGKLDLQRLHNSMVSIQAVINDAEKKQLTDGAVREWVDKLKDVAYDIDRVLDEWRTAILKAKIDRVENPSSNVGSMIREYCIQFNIAGKIKDLNKRLDVLDDKEKLINMLSSDGPNLNGELDVIADKRDMEWVYIMGSLSMELSGAVFDQLASQQKPHYALIAMLLSCTGTLLSVLELVYKARKDKVEWRFPCFYYPHLRHDIRFGSFQDIFGLVSSLCQSIVVMINYSFVARHANFSIKISIWPMVFAFGVVFSKVWEGHNNKKGKTRLHDVEETLGPRSN